MNPCSILKEGVISVTCPGGERGPSCDEDGFAWTDGNGVANIVVGSGVDRYKSDPESGRKLLRGFSAYMRASKAWPTRGISAWDRRSGFPAATSNCHSTRSSPVIISVTGCST